MEYMYKSFLQLEVGGHMPPLAPGSAIICKAGERSQSRYHLDPLCGEGCTRNSFSPMPFMYSM